METPRTAVGGARGEGEDAGLGQGEIGAGGVVGGVAGAEGDNEIIGVVATVEEKADERFVIGGDRGAGDRRELRAVGGAGGGTHEAEAAEGREQAGGTDGGAASVAEEFAAGDFGGGLFAHGRREGGRDEERGRRGRRGTFLVILIFSVSRVLVEGGKAAGERGTRAITFGSRRKGR